MRVTAPFAMAFVLGISAVAAGPAGAHAPRRTRLSLPHRHPLATSSASRVAPRSAWAEDLPDIHVFNKNTGAARSIRLYASDGNVDEAAFASFVALCGSDALDIRMVKLAFRAAYHFEGAQMTIISTTRKGEKGRHSGGEAIDFALDGVATEDLAAYLRSFPRAGVGVYPHPKTQYAHLDVRDRSYHWVDPSPPGVTWRERLLDDPKQAVRDGSYDVASDLPEAAAQPR